MTVNRELINVAYTIEGSGRIGIKQQKLVQRFDEILMQFELEVLKIDMIKYLIQIILPRSQYIVLDIMDAFPTKIRTEKIYVGSGPFDKKLPVQIWVEDFGQPSLLKTLQLETNQLLGNLTTFTWMSY